MDYRKLFSLKWWENAGDFLESVCKRRFWTDSYKEKKVGFEERFKSLQGVVGQAVFSTGGIEMKEDACIEHVFSLLQRTKERRGIVYVIGNGGSAGIASHFSADLIKALEIPSQTLFDSNLVTCLANDYGYPEVFSYPLSKLGKDNDLLFAISSSGKSPNILNAARIAHEKKMPVVSLSGFSPANPLRDLGTVSLFVESQEYGLVEMAHFFFLHTLIDLWSLKAKEGQYAKSGRSQGF